jgi:hypothetical protein
MAKQGFASRLRTHDLSKSLYPARTSAKAGFLEIVVQDEGAARMRRRSAAGPLAQHPIMRDENRTDSPVQECCGFSGTSLSLSAIRPSSGSERAFIFRIARLRWTFTVASAMPISPAICLLRRPRAT